MISIFTGNNGNDTNSTNYHLLSLFNIYPIADSTKHSLYTISFKIYDNTLK